MLALLLVTFIARYLPRPGEWHRHGVKAQPLHLTPDLKRLVWSYSLAGFGYILPATFLSQMAALRFPAVYSPSLSGRYLARHRWWELR